MRFVLTALLLVGYILPAQTQVIVDHYNPPKGQPKNIIIMIGHGMGMDQITAGLIKSNGEAHWGDFPVVGFINPVSGGKLITDPLMNVQHLAYGDSIYFRNDGDVAQYSLFDWAKRKKMKTAIITTGSVTGKVPASFLSPRADISGDSAARLYLEKDVDFIVGGGAKHFGGTGKDKNLLAEFYKKNYTVEDKLRKIGKLKGNKIIALVHDDKFYSAKHRKDYLPEASSNMLSMLQAVGTFGFIAVIESDQIARASMENELDYMAGEVQDFNNAVGEVLNMYGQDDQTLMIVLGDGEHGGLTVTGGNPEKGTLEGSFSSKTSSAELLPLFAIGPGSEEFRGIYTSKDIYKKIISFLERRK